MIGVTFHWSFTVLASAGQRYIKMLNGSITRDGNTSHLPQTLSHMQSSYDAGASSCIERKKKKKTEQQNVCAAQVQTKSTEKLLAVSFFKHFHG